MIRVPAAMCGLVSGETTLGTPMLAPFMALEKVNAIDKDGFIVSCYTHDDRPRREPEPAWADGGYPTGIVWEPVRSEPYRISDGDLIPKGYWDYVEEIGKRMEARLAEGMVVSPELLQQQTDERKFMVMDFSGLEVRALAAYTKIGEGKSIGPNMAAQPERKYGVAFERELRRDDGYRLFSTAANGGVKAIPIPTILRDEVDWSTEYLNRETPVQGGGIPALARYLGGHLDTLFNREESYELYYHGGQLYAQHSQTRNIVMADASRVFGKGSAFEEAQRRARAALLIR